MSKHYKQFNPEPIEFIKSFDLNFNLGNTVKYLLRAEYKGNYKKDISKAIDYIEYELKKDTNTNFILVFIKSLFLNFFLKKLNYYFNRWELTKAQKSIIIDIISYKVTKNKDYLVKIKYALRVLYKTY